jgi:hypothetical protein
VALHAARRAASLGTTGALGLVNAARSAAALSVGVILWQGATAGQLLFFRLHEAGAIATHVFTGLAALAVFLMWRTWRDRLWPMVVAGARLDGPAA